MPDPVLARKRYWWDFMKKDLGIDQNTVIIGHSSGAEAALRWAEEHKVAGGRPGRVLFLG
jgi:predicted alpha/beta hydrolase family esterase